MGLGLGLGCSRCWAAPSAGLLQVLGSCWAWAWARAVLLGATLYCSTWNNTSHLLRVLPFSRCHAGAVSAALAPLARQIQCLAQATLELRFYPMTARASVFEHVFELVLRFARLKTTRQAHFVVLPVSCALFATFRSPALLPIPTLYNIFF